MHVGAARDQHVDGGLIPVLDGRMQGRESTGLRGVDRRTGVEQTFENSGAAFGNAAGGGGMQGQVPHVVYGADVHVSAPRQQQFDAVQVAVVRGQVQRRPTSRTGRVDG